MAKFASPLEASSYLHPERHVEFGALRQKTIQQMTERGIEYSTLAEHPVSWADDQDPFGHVMTQAYAHVNGKCFNRFLESFHEKLQDEFPRFMSGRGIGPMTNKLNLTIKTPIKYPDLLLTGIRIAERGKRVNLREEGGVYLGLHESLRARAAKSAEALKAWEEGRKERKNVAKL
ncbi:hypothetical protein ATEIFO6365_0005003200 [Aspergillus terreus]|uniref:Uncharacterized protein n=1 Tax=Aspergillus terreus TaxID=33178 RepID=A0A5M3Z1V9_ASPTE|nr:hypothetical protein ATETN484_0007003700 [Aspergillus terreus]GFF15842.1 hypothetical protein ATEIFO6365_0005003200 [Aspergillus terreus]